MATFFSVRLCAFTAVLICGLPSTLLAGGDYLGTWQPYSDPDLWFGTMTIREDRIIYETGAKAGLAPIRDGGSVFLLVDPQGGIFDDCGNKPATYIGFHVLRNGLLAVLHYQSDTPPREPQGGNELDIVQNESCSVAFFRR